MFEVCNARKAYYVGEMRWYYVHQKPIGSVGRLCNVAEVVSGVLGSKHLGLEVAIWRSYFYISVYEILIQLCNVDQDCLLRESW